MTAGAYDPSDVARLVLSVLYEDILRPVQDAQAIPLEHEGDYEFIGDDIAIDAGAFPTIERIEGAGANALRVTVAAGNQSIPLTLLVEPASPA